MPVPLPLVKQNNSYQETCVGRYRDDDLLDRDCCFQQQEQQFINKSKTTVTTNSYGCAVEGGMAATAQLQLIK